MGKGRAPCCDKSQVKKGPWSPVEDLRLISFIQKNGHENWRALPKQAGLLRCGKSCRLRWINYLRPDVKRGNFTREEEETIIMLHQALGNKWSKIASHLPGRTDNEIKNVWNTHLKKRLSSRNVDLNGPEPKEFSTTSSSSSSSSTTMSCNDERNMGVELNPLWNQASMNKKPRTGQVCNESRPSREAKEFSSCCISSNHSNVTSSISRKAEYQMGSILDIIGPYGTVLTTLEEVNKPEMQEIASEIPLESDYDFWNMLDNLRAFQSNEIQLNNCAASTFNYGGGEVENKRWLLYLENELGLDLEANQGNRPKDVVEPLFPQTFQREKLLNQEVNPGNGNYLLWPSL